MATMTKAQLLEENQRLRRRVASLERSAKKRAAESASSRRLRRELADAQAQQTATADILRVISSSPTELQPVLETLVRSATRFCGADDAVIHRLEGDGLPVVVAHHGPIAAPMGFVTPAVHGTT